jgi:hypothetical protein
MSPENQTEDSETVVIDDKKWLSDDERIAYDAFVASFQRGGPETYPLGPQIVINLFSLYITGTPIKDIAALNHNYSLGQIAYAAVDGDWEKQRKVYLKELFDKAKDRLAQTVAEGASFVELALAVAHKRQGDKMKKYLQTEDPQYLKDSNFEITSFKSYKEAVETLLKLTGQDRTKVLQVEDRRETPPAAELPPPPGAGPYADVHR